MSWQITTDQSRFYRFYQKSLWKVVHNQFTSYLQINERLTKTQSGNKKWHSTETSVIETIDTILKDDRTKRALLGSSSRKFVILFVLIAAAVIVLLLGGIVSVVCSVVFSKGCKPFMRDLTRAATSSKCWLRTFRHEQGVWQRQTRNSDFEIARCGRLKLSYSVVL